MAQLCLLGLFGPLHPSPLLNWATKEPTALPFPVSPPTPFREKIQNTVNAKYTKSSPLS